MIKLIYSYGTEIDLENALTLDSTAASHPVVQAVDNPSQINELFDSISYDKGASLIRMVLAFTDQAMRQAGTSTRSFNLNHL